MAKGKKTGGRDIQPGQILNPTGRPKVDPQIKEIRKLTSVMFYETVQRMVSMTALELNEYLKTGKATTLETMIAGQIQAATKGKTTPISFLLDRTIGPVKQVVEMKGTVDVSEEQAIRMAQRMLKRQDEAKEEG